MARVFRTVRVNGDGGCACPTCAASGPTTTARRDEPVPPMPDLGEALRPKPQPAERPYDVDHNDGLMPLPRPIQPGDFKERK